MLARPISLASLIAACALALPWSSGAVAEVYKWVDEKGVTNYAGAPPATGRARSIDLSSASVSVYEAPPPQPAARALDAAVRARMERLENELLAERRARQASTQAESDRRQLAYEQCLRDRRVDCDLVRDGLPATDYFTPHYAVAAPFVPDGRSFLPPRRMRAGPQPAFGAVLRFQGSPPRIAAQRGPGNYRGRADDPMRNSSTARAH